MSDEYKSIPVAVARAAVQASGELEGVEGPHFRVVNAEWASFFLPFDGHEHPDLARVIVTRKGQAPREVVISWDEYAAELEIDDPEWLAKRTQKPMGIFGAEVERHAYRVVFADVLAPLLAPTRIVADVNGHVPTESWSPRIDRLMVVPDAVPTRDWSAEVDVADAATLNALYDEARAAGALVSVEGLQAEFTARLIELSTAPKPKPVPRPVEKPRAQGNRRRGKRPGPKP